MAIGDDAAAAGMELVSGSTDLVKNGADHHNLTRDYIAQRTNAVTPVEKGGTGATTAAQARTNLGAASTSSVSAAAAAAAAAQSTANGAQSDATKARTGDLDIAVWNREVTWTRRAAWLGNNGLVELGYASSLRAHKQNITPVAFPLDTLRRIPIVTYRYRAEVAKERRQDGYRAATEIGTLAEDMHELGLWPFVVYEGRGDDAKPVAVHYELLALAALDYAQQLHDRLAQLEQRLTDLEEPSA